MKRIYIIIFIIIISAIYALVIRPKRDNEFEFRRELLRAKCVEVNGFPDVALDKQLIKTIARSIGTKALKRNEIVELDGFTLSIQDDGEISCITITPEYWIGNGTYYKYVSTEEGKLAYEQLKLFLFSLSSHRGC